MGYSNQTSEAIELLKQMISIESFSRNELQVADFLQKWLKNKGLDVNRKGNNIWVWACEKDNSKPTILLNSHIDTVKPGSGWNSDPLVATVLNDQLTGLGSNDAGASVVSLIQAFLFLKETSQSYNLVLAITAEEEISGMNGVGSLFEELGTIDLAIVGEPTQMNMAIAERGLLVLDCHVAGKTGHAARNEGVNAIYEALPIINWFKTYSFDKISDRLGPVKMTVTQIESGSQHNVVPDNCHFVVDIRINEYYSNHEIFEAISQMINCKIEPRSFRLNSSRIEIDHPIVLRGLEIGLTPYGSPTTSDQAIMNFTTIKIGPGDSARSHTANEYISFSEIELGINTYTKLLNGLVI